MEIYRFFTLSIVGKKDLKSFTVNKRYNKIAIIYLNYSLYILSLTKD